jgi:predicted DNA-binding protein (MmcQ/YjbR family)
VTDEKKLKNYLYQVVQLLCLSFPESEEFLSHGAPNFRVKKGKIFALFADSHHGDALASIWLNAPVGAQTVWVEAAGKKASVNDAGSRQTSTQPTYFIPPYLGPRGWLGVRLDKDLPWTHIFDLVHEAYCHTAHAKWHSSIKGMPKLPPAPSVKAVELEQLEANAAQQKYLVPLRKLCLSWPETSEATSYHQLAWRAGKRTFVQLVIDTNRTGIAFLADGEMQSLLAEDPRFFLPRYFGARGWIAFNVRHAIDWQELGAYLLASYRSVALKRMLLALDAR